MSQCPEHCAVRPQRVLPPPPRTLNSTGRGVEEVRTEQQGHVAARNIPGVARIDENEAEAGLPSVLTLDIRPWESTQPGTLVPEMLVLGMSTDQDKCLAHRGKF